MVVIKRDRTRVAFNPDKIRDAVRAAFGSVGIDAEDVPDKVVTDVCSSISYSTPVDIERIQDIVEQSLLRHNARAVAASYIRYRDTRARMRAATTRDDPDARYLKSDLARFQFYDKYARANYDMVRRETFVESADRIFDFLRADSARMTGRELSDSTWSDLRAFYLQQAASPAMRIVQMAGPALQRCHVGAYNCAFHGIASLDALPESLYISMQGAGVGFSVEQRYVGKLPEIAAARSSTMHHISIEDTTEGWCDSLRFGIQAWYAGEDVEFDYSAIRPKGAPLRTKGGTASGPGPLRRLHDYARNTIFNRMGSQLRPVDVHNIMCVIGEVGQLGGVRRGALISLSDLDDSAIRDIKSPGFHADPNRAHLTVANNSAVYNHQPSDIDLITEWRSLYLSFSGERGIFNREGLWQSMPKRRRELLAREFPNCQIGTNPCGEIVLIDAGQFCNLSIAVVRPDDTISILKEKVRAAARIGTIQSTLTDFKYINPKWRRSCEAERLIGVDLLGARDNPIFRGSDAPRLLRKLRKIVIDTNVETAAQLGIPASTATTCIKPGGNSSVFFGTGQSMSGWMAPHFIRRTEVSASSAIGKFLVDAGVPHEVSVRDSGTLLINWPVKAPVGASIMHDLTVSETTGDVTARVPRDTAIDQLEFWKTFKQNWTEHNPSVTIFVAEHEWIEVLAWVKRNWELIGGIAFCPLDMGSYEQMPYEAISEARYNQLMREFPAHIDWSQLAAYETKSGLYAEANMDIACSGGRCSVLSA